MGSKIDLGGEFVQFWGRISPILGENQSNFGGECVQIAFNSLNTLISTVTRCMTLHVKRATLRASIQANMLLHQTFRNCLLLHRFARRKFWCFFTTSCISFMFYRVLKARTLVSFNLMLIMFRYLLQKLTRDRKYCTLIMYWRCSRASSKLREVPRSPARFREAPRGSARFREVLRCSADGNVEDGFCICCPNLIGICDLSRITTDWQWGDE